MSRTRLGIGLLLSHTVVWALVNAYHIGPQTAAMSGWTRTPPSPSYYVSQQVVVNFDSLRYVELFAGEYGQGGSYNLEVLTHPGGTPVASKTGRYSRPQAWVVFDTIAVTRPESIVKGAMLEFRFTRGGSDSLQYYYSEEAYDFGSMSVGGTQYEDRDLALRVFGAMRPVRAEDWGFNVGWPDTACTTAVRRRADSAGVSADRFWFGADWMARTDTVADTSYYEYPIEEVRWSREELGCEQLGLLVGCPKWASTRIDSLWTWVPDTANEGFWEFAGLDTSGLCPPRGLFASVASDTNYWAKFVKFVVDHSSSDGIHTWEAYNEANVIDRFWQRPNTGWYEDYTSDSGMCQLYTRLCVVTDSAVRSVGGHQNDMVLVGSMSEVENAGADPYRVRGKDWLRMMYHFSGGFRWDGVTVHPYQPAGQAFDPALFLRNADTIRAVMREHGDYGPLWITELGWNTRPYGGQQNSVSEEQQAVNFCQTYTAALASEASPSAGYDRVYWFSFVDIGGENAEHFSLLDTMPDCLPKDAVWASGQTRDMLAGKRYNGRVTSGEPAVDAHLYTYEFEDAEDGRKTWVAWRQGAGTPNTFSFPVRVDEPDTMMLAYDAGEVSGSKNADASGWLPVALDTRPVFISEPESALARRPELVVDSLRLLGEPLRVGKPMGYKVALRNTGTRATPDSIRIDIRVNDSLLTWAKVGPLDSAATDTVIVVGLIVPGWMYGSCLIRAVANDGQTFVELGGLDDNSGYVRTQVRYPPQGNVAPVLGNGRSDVPRVILNLSSISFENDSLPCESLQLLQARFGLSDTVPDTIIASGWFRAKACTTWQFLAGEGRYLFGLLASDDRLNISDTAWSDFIVFDSTPPAVSVAVNSGAAFTNDASVLVSWAGADSLSPACSVRLGNAALVNVVSGSGFGASDTLWRYTKAQTDGPSGMVSLEQGTDTAAVWQVLPKAVYESLVGRYVRLSGDVLVEAVGAPGAVGRVEYGYVFESDSLQSPDTLLYVSNYIEIEPGPGAHVGQDKLQDRFTCPSPPSINGYKCVAAFVRCRTGEEVEDTGLVWLDNLKLEHFGPDSEPTLSDWLPADSIQSWTLSPGDGRKTVWLAVQDETGNETRVETCDSINLDTTPPEAAIDEPTEGSKVNGEFKLLGAAFDPVAAAGDTWFESYRLEYSLDGDEWTPVDPQTEFFEPAVPTWDSVYEPPAYYPATLGYWDTEELQDGEYYVRLTVTDSAGNQSQDVTWYGVANQERGESEYDASGPDGGGSGLGEGSILVGSATGALRVYDEELNVLSTRTVTDSGTTAYITAAVRHSPDTLILLNARAHTLLALGSTGEPVRLARGLGLPTGIAKDASGAYWLTDKLSGRLARYKRGEGLELISDSLSGPEAVGTRGDRVYVADTRANRIAVYDTTGEELQSITGSFTGPQAIALPSSGGIYLTEPQTGTIKGITSDGSVYYTLNNTTVHKCLLASPDGTKLYTLKPAGNRVLSYRIRSADSLPGGGQAAGERNLPRTLTLNAPRPNPSNRQTQLSYGLPRSSRVSIRLYDAAGRQCANLADCQQKAGWYHLAWDGTGNGRALPAGVYFIQLSTDSGRTQKKLIRTE